MDLHLNTCSRLLVQEQCRDSGWLGSGCLEVFLNGNQRWSSALRIGVSVGAEEALHSTCVWLVFQLSVPSKEPFLKRHWILSKLVWELYCEKEEGISFVGCYTKLEGERLPSKTWSFFNSLGK